MSTITCCNHGTYFKPLLLLVLVISIVCTPNHAKAGPAFKNLADANNELYRTARNLGPDAKPSELLAAQNRIMGPAMAALNKEHYETYQKWKKSIKDIFAGTKADLERLLGKGRSGKGAAPGAGGTPVPAPPAARAAVQTDTGKQGGGAGATGAVFGGKREDKNAPKADPSSGIIMEQ